jgi:hypothetical protein
VSFDGLLFETFAKEAVEIGAGRLRGLYQVSLRRSGGLLSVGCDETDIVCCLLFVVCCFCLFAHDSTDDFFLK